jgi:hypothetical protein
MVFTLFYCRYYIQTITEWRWSDLKKDFIKHLEDESNRPRTTEREHSKRRKDEAA